MRHSRRLTDQERRQIVRERAKGVAVRDLAIALKVSPKTVYNVLSHGRSAVSANDSRSRVLTMRVTDRDLRGFDAALSRRGIAHRSDAMRCLMLAADDLLRPDENMTDELRALSAALNRVGNNVNQVARRLNEAKLRGERLPYTPASHAEICDLAVLVFDLADQIQEMFRARRRVLDLEVTKALAGLAQQSAGHGAE
jgi:transposase-like protein